MEKCIINKELLTHWGLSMKEAILLLALHEGFASKTVRAEPETENLSQRGFVITTPRKCSLTSKAMDFIESTQKEYHSLSNIPQEYTEMRSLWPAGLSHLGVDYRCSTLEIASQVKTLEKVVGRTLSPIDILTAAKRYISSHCDSQYLKTIKNFIIKEERDEDDSVKYSSDLLNYLEGDGFYEQQTNNFFFY